MSGAAAEVHDKLRKARVKRKLCSTSAGAPDRHLSPYQIQEESSMSTEQIDKSSGFVEVYKAAAPTTLTWAEMDQQQKLKRVAKICVCIISFGMIFPNALG